MPTSCKKDENLLIDFLNEELVTKTSIHINVWVEGLGEFDNIGSCYADILQLYSALGETKAFTDTSSGRKELIHTRVAHCTRNIESSLMDTSSCTVLYLIWFCPDLPNPAIDLSKYGNLDVEDKVPIEFKAELDNDGPLKKWRESVEHNFYDDALKEGRYFNHLKFKDLYSHAHYPMSYLSRISSPDNFKLDHDALILLKVVPRIVTIPEIAHYVRMIPTRPSLLTWASPDFLLQIK